MAISSSGHQPLVASQTPGNRLERQHSGQRQERAGLIVGSVADADRRPMIHERQAQGAGHRMRHPMGNDLHRYAPRPVDLVFVEDGRERAAAEISRRRHDPPALEVGAASVPPASVPPARARQSAIRAANVCSSLCLSNCGTSVAGNPASGWPRSKSVSSRRQTGGAVGDDGQFQRLNRTGRGLLVCHDLPGRNRGSRPTNRASFAVMRRLAAARPGTKTGLGGRWITVVREYKFPRLSDKPAPVEFGSAARITCAARAAKNRPAAAVGVASARASWSIGC